MRLTSVLLATICILCRAESCTSFVVTSNVKNQIPILAKVRDKSYPISEAALHKQDLRFFHHDGYFAYVAVMYGQKNLADGERSFISAGTNEKGLSIALNFATSQRSLTTLLYGYIAPQESNILKNILESASTVAEAKSILHRLNEKNLLVPCMLTLSDGQEGLVVEIASAPDKKIYYTFKTTEATGYAYTTNHFDTPSLTTFNIATTEDSAARHERIQELLSHHKAEYTFGTALQFAKDYNDGELNSIFRNASRMTYIVQGNQTKSTLFVEFTNTVQLYNRALITLDSHFWSEHKNGDVIIAADQPYRAGPTIEKFVTF